MSILSMLGRRKRSMVLEVMTRLLDRIWLRRFSKDCGRSPNSSTSWILFATSLMHSSCKVLDPFWTIPSSRLLWTCRRFSLFTTCFFGFWSFLLWSSCTFEHLVQSSPPSGPVLLYAVTVNRFWQISQFSS